jgi:pimeloyl-ACP methyl ester carboxylesterase
MIAHHFAELNHLRIHYAKAGEGQPMVFLHGFPEFWYEWKNQLAEFSLDHLAVAPDMRGYNLSAKPAQVDAYRIETLVEDVRALAQHLGRDRIILVGHDWGGAVAWAFALYYPQILEKLVIINAPHPAIFQRELLRNAAQQRASQYMLLFRSPDAEHILSANGFSPLAEAVLGEGLKHGYLTQDDRNAYLEAWLQPGALTGGLNYYRAAKIGPPEGTGDFSWRDLSEDFPRLTVRVPTLVLWGEKDSYLLPGNLDGLEEYVPDLIIKRVPECSHWIVHENPDLVNATLREFIAGR